MDFGIAGPQTYKRWRERVGCEVEPCPSLDRSDFANLRAIYESGLGHVVDRQGLDWWDLTWLRWLDPLMEVQQAAKFVSTLGSSDELFVAPGRYAPMLDALAPGRVRRIGAPDAKRQWKSLKSLRRLTFAQVLEVLGDKYDGDYRWRRLIAPRIARCSSPLVLLPSAYGNASRTALTMAASLPEQEFLLVTTRRSACVNPLPSNVNCAPLASYAVATPDRNEIQALLGRWEGLLELLSERLEPAFLRKSGGFDTFPLYLHEGIAVRNCWARVLDREPVVSVLCADEKNPYTRIPILLAQKRQIPTVGCHHGALDGRYLFTDVCADQFLAKGEMEWEYLVDVCGVPKAKVRRSSERAPSQVIGTRTRGKLIVFFSEPYELSHCRAAAVYSETLSPLARIAKEQRRELVIKLHPFESLRHRRQLVEQVLPPGEQGAVRFVGGPLTEELMDQTWFGITVTSSAAIDCAKRGIPAFLCLWLDRYGFGYGEHFTKFGAAMPLRSAEEIGEIPMRLEEWDNARPRGVSSNVPPQLLRDTLFRNPSTDNDEVEPEKLWA